MTYKLFAGYGRRLCKCTQRLGVIFAIAASAACLPSAQAINLPESTNKLMYARELNLNYIVPMGMHRKPASYAFTTLLGEGFRCNLELVSPMGLDEPPLADCFKSPSGFGPLCNDLYITARFLPQPTIGSREELFRQLDKVLVKNAMAFCSYPDEVPVEFVTARDVAEGALRLQVAALGLPGNAFVAYEKLLMQDYYCGFAVEPSAEASKPAGSAAQMVCTKWRTGIHFCHEAKLVMDMEWPSGITSIKQFYAALPQTTVKAVRSSCEIPGLQSGARGAEGL